MTAAYRDAGPRPNPYDVLWHCLGTCDVHWWGPASSSDDDWYEAIGCKCPIGAEPDFEVVDLGEPGPGQRTLL